MQYPVLRSKKKFFHPRGIASMAEIVLVVGIFTLLLGLGIFSLTRTVSSSSISSTVYTFISDFKNQQIKAMQGDTENSSSPNNYGIHFDTTTYTLFRGAWSPSDPNNFTVRLPSNIQVTTTFVDLSGEQIIYFKKGNGDIASYNPQKTINFKDNSANIEETISVSESGATSIN